MTVGVDTIWTKVPAAAEWLERRVPTIFGLRTPTVVILIIVYTLLAMGAIIGAQQGHEAQSIGETLMYVDGGEIVTGGEAEPIGYEADGGFFYHVLGAILYASFHIAMAAGTVMAIFTYATSHIIPIGFWQYVFGALPALTFIFVAWGLVKDGQALAQLLQGVQSR